MLSKLFQIFLVLALGVLFACLFSLPVRNIRYYYGKWSKNIPFLRKNKKLRNVLAVLSWYLLLILFMGITLWLLYYNLYQYFIKVSWEEFISKIQFFLERIRSSFPFMSKTSIMNSTPVNEFITNFIKLLMKLPGILGKIIVGIMISIYLLMDQDYYLSAFRQWKKDCLNKKQRNMVNNLMKETRQVLFGYLRGQSLDALVMGNLIGIGLWLFGVPLGIPIGIFAGIGNLIPYVGPVLAFSLTAFFCLIEGKTKTLIYAIIYLILVQQVDGSYIGPKLLGKQMEIRPLFVIISILVGGTLFGPIGMLFAVPGAAILKSVLKLLRKECCA